MKTLIIVTIVMISIIANASAQDREIGNARARMTTVLAASNPGITYADLFNTRPLPALGWNWDTPISQLNDLSFAHTLHVGYRYPWTDANGLINGFGTRFRDSSTNDPNQTVWLYPHVDGLNPSTPTQV